MRAIIAAEDDARNRASLLQAVRTLNDWRRTTAYPGLPPEALDVDRVLRRRKRALPACLSSAIVEHCRAVGLSDNTRKSYENAAATAYVHAPRAPTTLDELTDPELIAAVDGALTGPALKAWRAVRGYLTCMRRYEDLPWTPAWRALQQAVVAAGVAPADNPVPDLLAEAAGREPAELDTAWAQGVMFSLRYDRRRTWAAVLGRLERLRAHRQLAGSLPAPLGAISRTAADMRRRGASAKALDDSV